MISEGTRPPGGILLLPYEGNTYQWSPSSQWPPRCPHGTNGPRYLKGINSPRVVKLPKMHLHLNLTFKRICPFKASYLHLKELEKYIREPSDHTRSRPTPGIYMGDCGQKIQIQNDKYMPFVMNMVIMCHVHHLSTEINRD